MRIICAYSSIEFECSHIPGTFHSPELYHPIFSLPQKRLLAFTSKWSHGELTPTDSYLLFLAILNSSDLIEWRVPAARCEQTDSLVANNLESLLKTVIKLNTVPNPDTIFPHYAISPDTRFLTNVRYWIENWEDSYRSYKSGYRSAHESAITIRREAALTRMIRSKHRSVSSYSRELAYWAAQAGSFPTFIISSPFASSLNSQISCSDYWQECIVRCTKNEYIFSIPDKDLEELISHCEDNIPVGSIHSNALFTVLRTAQKRKKTFLDLGDPDAKASYTLLSSQSTAESANLKALIDSAPEDMPVREHYPSSFAYMKAKLRWDMAKKYGKGIDDSDSSPELI